VASTEELSTHIFSTDRFRVNNTIGHQVVFRTKQLKCVIFNHHCFRQILIDLYMSYRWRESFNTVNLQIRDVITTGIDMCGRRMQKGGGDGPYIRRGTD